MVRDEATVQLFVIQSHGVGTTRCLHTCLVGVGVTAVLLIHFWLVLAPENVFILVWIALEPQDVSVTWSGWRYGWEVPPGPLPGNTQEATPESTHVTTLRPKSIDTSTQE